jgi:hypothetical protein
MHIFLYFIFNFHSFIQYFILIVNIKVSYDSYEIQNDYFFFLANEFTHVNENYMSFIYYYMAE